MPSGFNAYHKWLGIPPRHQPPTHYRLLGLEAFESDPDVIEAAAERQMAHIQNYKIGPQSDISQKLLNEIARAKICLLNPSSKADYDASLRREGSESTPPPSLTHRSAESPTTIDELDRDATTPPTEETEAQFPAAPIPLQRPVAGREQRTKRSSGGLIAAVGVGIGLIAILALATSLARKDQLPTPVAKEMLDTEVGATHPKTVGIEPPKEPRTEIQTDPTDRLVLYNEHNAQHRDGGARAVNIYLLDSGRIVWQELGQSVAWQPTADPATEFVIPRQKYDSVRVQLVSWHASHGGLSEIELWRDGVNLARGKLATSSHPPLPGDKRTADCVTDGITTSQQYDVGYWTLPAGVAGAVEIDLNRLAPSKPVPPPSIPIATPQPRPDEAGFEFLFNGRDLTGWTGAASSYSVEGSFLVSRGSAQGNLYTVKEYGNFDLRFEYRLTSGADSGIGIRAPTGGDPAFAGMEIQLIDESSERFRGVAAWQKNGSICGIATAKQGSQKAPGQWNSEQIVVRSDHAIVLLNGVTILDADLPNSDTSATLDGKPHPGLDRARGHLVLMGASPRVEFRDIRVKDLGESPPSHKPAESPKRRVERPVAKGTFPEIKLPSGKTISAALLSLATKTIKDDFSRTSNRSRLPKTVADSTASADTLIFVLRDAARDTAVGLFSFGDGKFNGPALLIGDNGHPSVVASYAADRRNGVLRSWDSEGTLILFSEYKTGTKLGITCLCEDGRPVLIEDWETSSERHVYLVEYNGTSANVTETKRANSEQRRRIDETEKTLKSVERLLSAHEKQWKTTFLKWWRSSGDEITRLQTALKTTRDPAMKKKLQTQLDSALNKLRSESRKDIDSVLSSLAG